MKRALIFYASVAVIIAAAVVLIPHCPAQAEPNSKLRARIFTNSRNASALVTPNEEELLHILSIMTSRSLAAEKRTLVAEADLDACRSAMTLAKRHRAPMVFP